MKSKNLLIFVGFVVFIFGVLVGVITVSHFLSNTSGIPENEVVAACTREAKLCPDGTSVGRTGPNCEFAACPLGDAIPSVPAGVKDPSVPRGFPGPNNADLVCPPGTYKDVANPDEGYQCFPDGTMHTL